MQDVQRLRQIRAFAEHDLHLHHVVLQLVQRPLQQHLALVQDADVVAHVLQLAQVVGADQNRRAALLHVLQHQAPDLTAHHGIETVHRLVEYQHLRAAGNRQQEGRLLLHALGEAAKLGLGVEIEALAQLLIELAVKAFISFRIEVGHVGQAGGGEVEHVVGDVGNACLNSGVLIDRLPADGDRAAVGTEDAGDVADHGGLARTVRADQSVHRTVRDSHGQIVQRHEAVKGLSQVLHFNHGDIPP